MPVFHPQRRDTAELIVFHYLAPGSLSDEHREALSFAAQEYERLASEVTDAALLACARKSQRIKGTRPSLERFQSYRSG